MKNDILENVRIVELPKIEDLKGNLSYVEAGIHIPFDIKRAYWIYDVPVGVGHNDIFIKNT